VRYPTAGRTLRIEPFYVMEIVKEAQRLAQAGRSIVHLSIGEPDFTAPAPVQAAARQAIESGLTQYTPALGTDALREAIAADYARRFQLAVDPERVVVTAGASGALLLALAALLERDSTLLMPDPSYPCNRHFATVLEGRAQLLPCGPETRFQPTAAMIDAAWSAQTGGVLLASPSNPTGTSIEHPVLAAIADRVRARSGFLIVDEIYQGLTYDRPASTVLSLGEDMVALASFSKYFSMTGWRLGWLVAPPGLVPTLERLAQNLFICPSAIAQHAALACFGADASDIYEGRREEFRRRRDFLVPALRRIGFDVPVVPDGAFYVYAGIGRFGMDSWEFAFDLLRQTGVCVVPGRDFGTASTAQYVRLSYANKQERLEEAVDRMDRYLRGRAPGSTTEGEPMAMPTSRASTRS
jgi:aspartate/methionine/tyrosine aminotransferase